MAPVPDSPARSTWARSLLAVLSGVLAIGFTGAVHMFGHSSLVLWWACGALTGLMLRWGWREGMPMWGGAVIAQVLLGAAPHQALLPATGMVLGPMILVAWLEHRGFEADFSRREYAWPFALATAIAMTLPPTINVVGMAAFGLGPGRIDPAARWSEWWVHATLSVLLIAPAVSAMSRATFRRWMDEPRPRLLAIAVLGALLFVSAELPTPIGRALTWPPALIATFVVMQRTDLVFGSLYLLVVAMGMLLETGPGEVGRVFAMVMVGTNMLVRVLFAERERVERQLESDEARYRADLLAAGEEERRRIGRDMHDTVGQELTSITLLGTLVERQARGGSASLAARAAAVLQACERSTASARAVARDLLGARGGA